MSNQRSLNKSFLKLRKRAESADRSKLVDTFVDVGPLFTLLSNPDHQILYGRRGTGKTHALIYLAENVKKKGDLPVYLDLRTIGSTGGIYADPKIPLKERATRLLTDMLHAVHDEFLEYAIDNDEKVNLEQIDRLLNLLADAITEVEVIEFAEYGKGTSIQPEIVYRLP